MRDLDATPSWAEFICAIKYLTNGKSPIINGVPPNALKLMLEENLRHHFNLITEFWEDTVDLEEWN